MIYQTVVLASIFALSNAKLFISNEEQQTQLWQDFKRDYGKKYPTMQEEYSRFSNFLVNLRIADQRNKLEEGTAIHGITKFFDLSQEEFASRYLLAKPPLKSESPLRSYREMGVAPNAAAGLVDWEGKLTTPVKNQGYCGSCWAFSATEQIESDAIRTLGATFLLSPQQIVSCASFPDMGCNGGWTEGAYTYVKNAGGLETEADYPYTSYSGSTGQCKAVPALEKVTVTGFTTLKSESDMAAYVQTTGPLSVCIDANSWNSYIGGIMATCGTSVDHCVQAVGVDASAGGYWKVRNSWGTSWGENGHIRLAYGQNTCAIVNDPTYAAVALV